MTTITEVLTTINTGLSQYKKAAIIRNQNSKWFNREFSKAYEYLLEAECLGIDTDELEAQLDDLFRLSKEFC